MLVIRKIEDRDREMLWEWIQKDREHFEAGTTADFFFEPETESFVYEDELGPVFFVRLSQDLIASGLLRIDIQFGADKKRTSSCMTEGFQSLVDRAKESGFKGMVFRSTSEPLIRFCVKRFSFEKFGDELFRPL
jgi:hypothetical protein